jgi:uncharacterized protein YvpB
LVNWAVQVQSVTKILDRVPYVNQVTAQKLYDKTTPAGGVWYLCGPSSAAMVLGYYNKISNPTNAAANELNRELLINGATSWPNMSGALSRRGVNNSGALNKLSFEEIVAQIDANHPIIMGLWYSNAWNTNAGHVTVIVGYDKPSRTLIVNDPFGPWGWWNDYNHLANSVTGRDGGIHQRYPYDRLNNNSDHAYFGNMMKTSN